MRVWGMGIRYTVSSQKYTPFFAHYFETKVGRGICLITSFISCSWEWWPRMMLSKRHHAVFLHTLPVVWVWSKNRGLAKIAISYWNRTLPSKPGSMIFKSATQSKPSLRYMYILSLQLDLRLSTKWHCSDLPSSPTVLFIHTSALCQVSSVLLLPWESSVNSWESEHVAVLDRNWMWIGRIFWLYYRRLNYC